MVSFECVGCFPILCMNWGVLFHIFVRWKTVEFKINFTVKYLEHVSGFIRESVCVRILWEDQDLFFFFYFVGK